MLVGKRSVDVCAFPPQMHNPLCLSTQAGVSYSPIMSPRSFLMGDFLAEGGDLEALLAAHVEASAAAGEEPTETELYKLLKALRNDFDANGELKILSRNYPVSSKT